jgi:hypothetical protein
VRQFPRQRPSARHDTLILSRWLEVETARFNATYAKKEARTPLLEFLLIACKKASELYSRAFHELTRQARSRHALITATRSLPMGTRHTLHGAS